MAKRLEWGNGEGAHAYGEVEPIPCGGLVAVNFEDESIFFPEDYDGETFGLFDRANNIEPEGETN